MGRTAFVTGATGFIGINLVSLLIRDGWEVHALHRESSDLHFLERYPVTLHAGSVTDPEAVRQAIPPDTEVVFHLAGNTSLWARNNRKQWIVNVDGTHNVIEAAVSRDVKVLVHTSSASAWGEMSGEVITEKLPQRGQRSWVGYERSKWKSEQIVLSCSESRIRTVVLNPTAVTGPYDLNNWGRIFFALRDGQLPGIPNGVVSVTHVHEVAKAHLAAATRGRHGERYLLSGEDCSMASFVETIASVSGISDIPRHLPTPLLKAASYLELFRSSFTGTAPDLTPELVRVITRKDLSYSSEKAIAELDYRIVPMTETVRDTHRWMTEEGLL